MGTYLRRTPALLDVLSCLLEDDKPLWGLEIVRRSGRPTGTVYPILDRLETEQLISSEWDDPVRRGARRRLYRFTQSGREWAEAKIARIERRKVV